MKNLMTRIATRFNPKLGLWRFYTYPKLYLHDFRTEGYVDAWLKYPGHAQMIKAAALLRPLKVDEGIEPLEVHFLTGARFWYQTCFCAYSLMQQTRLNVRPVIYDDGTLNDEHRDGVLQVFPNARTVSAEETEARLDEY